MFAIDVKYKWHGSKHKDYTVKVHSLHENLEIYDDAGRTYQLNTDGKSPTEFTESTFCGMDAECVPNEVFEARTGNAPTTPDLWYLKRGADFNSNRSKNKDQLGKTKYTGGNVAVGAETDVFIDFETMESCGFFGMGCDEGWSCASVALVDDTYTTEKLCIPEAECG